MADLVLPPVSLLPEHDRRGPAVCGPELLLRLVERQQHHRVLENVELAGAPVVRATPLQANRRGDGLQQVTEKVFLSPTPTLMAFTAVTNAHGPSHQPTAYRSPSFSLTTATGSNQA